MDDFKQDLSARFKKVRGGETTAEAAPQASAGGPNFEEAYRIRARMIGVLLRDARQNARRTIEDCARLLQVAPDVVESWEFGDDGPSLPQLEILAYFLDVPVSHFWSTTTLEASSADRTSAQGEYTALRNRMIGVLLRQAREEAGVSLALLSEQSGIPAEEIDSYELGETPIPLHELTVLAHSVQKNVSYFLEAGGALGEWLTLRDAWTRFSRMPPEIRQFIVNPLNVGFIEIAKMFSEMPADSLRNVGKSMLDITL